MGMLSAALLTGLGQGGQVLAGGMLKEVERQAEQSIWEKRQKLLAEIQRESAQNQRIDARDFSVAPETLAANDTVARAAGATARGVKLAELTDDRLNAAARDKADRDAQDAARREIDATKTKAGDKDYLAANAAVLLADPRVKAAVAASNASAAASGAQARMSGEQYRQLVETGKVTDAVRDLRNKLAASKDPNERRTYQQQIGDILGGGDPSKFLGLADKAQDNIREAVKIKSDPLATPQEKADADRLMRMGLQLWNDARKLANLPEDDGGKPKTQAEAAAYAADAIKQGAPRDRVEAVMKGWGYAMPEEQAKPAKKGGGLLSTVRGDSPALAPAPAKPVEERIAELEKRLADDDYIKQSAGGSMARALERRTVPLAVVERRDLEEQLRRLREGR